MVRSQVELSINQIKVQSHPNMTEIDVQKGTAMDLQGRAIRLGDNSIGYVIDNKLHYEELEYDSINYGIYNSKSIVCQ